MALFTMEFCTYILPRPIEIRALLGAVSTEFCGSSAMKLGPDKMNLDVSDEGNIPYPGPTNFFFF